MRKTQGESVYVLLAPGFEETDVTEATSVLRRSGRAVVLVGLTAGPIRGAHGLLLVPDRTLSEVEKRIPGALVLPGGAAGAQRLGADPRVHAIMQRVFNHGGTILALDTSHMVLNQAGLPNVGKPDAHLTPGFAIPRMDKSAPATTNAGQGQVLLGQNSETVQDSVALLASLLHPAVKP